MNSKKTSVNHRFITYRSDEITYMAVVCEYTFQLVDICNLCRSRILPGLLSYLQI